MLVLLAGNTGGIVQKDKSLNAAEDTVLRCLLGLNSLACFKGFVPNLVLCNSSFLEKKVE